MILSDFFHKALVSAGIEFLFSIVWFAIIDNQVCLLQYNAKYYAQYIT